jgi:hypothetical protein
VPLPRIREPGSARGTGSREGGDQVSDRPGAFDIELEQESAELQSIDRIRLIRLERESAELQSIDRIRLIK